ncbi:Pkinase-domain-containing protein [Trametes versicolor FP-101664 SS1]|uniref:Pkinase-domain-containing protein n=1 Tax=Trametes versicolor (strain FP-101664) TaxID=717944 RepID=UPI0004623766|nr:Pkinase-domain-containing protein [Trametes versicolor FP-101664 SS1]EIW64963.1 Pkinase-domain-containing protein [Trametes versicolor FP-101664 SS1]
MAPKQPCAKYQYVVTPAGPKIVPVPDVYSKDEESPADYNSGGYLQVKINDSFKDGRYLVTRKLGWGHFSTVWLVKDNHTSRHSALKVVKSAGRYAETARDEIKLLRQVMDVNPLHPGRNHIVSFLDNFDHKGPDDSHICLVFEPLGENLLALIERHKKTGVAVDLVRVIAKQMLLGLQYLHDECDLVHTDIKPENILISIPDVEAHIQAELSRSPSPTCRKVAVPPKALTRVSVSIPQRKTGRERQVQIFDSQPLPSPSSVSCPNSPARLSYISRVASAQSANAALPSASLSSMNVIRRKSTSKLALSSGHFHSGASTPDTSESSGSGSSGSASRYDSVLVSSSLARSLSNDTPSTSINSLTSGMGKLALAQSVKGKEKALAPCTCTCGDQTFTEAGDEPDFKPMPAQARPAPGPSLLSQTAPQNLTPQRSASTCSQHPHSPDTLPAPLLDAVFEAPAPLPPPLPINIKIADLGNATPTTKHYTEDIQTRQYRAPEAIIGRTDWGATADIWSVACVVFELLTAEYLFDPQGQGDLFGKDDDHIAQIIELLGDFGETKVGGRFSRELFDSTGALRYIRNLKPWPLRRVMVEKYLWSESDAEAVCAFLEPMLVVDHRKRANARDMVDHPWLQVDPLSEELWGW